MRTFVLLCTLASACTLPSVTLTEGLDVHPASRPIGKDFTAHERVEAKGCEPAADVGRLIHDATGAYDAIVQLTVSRQVTYTEGHPTRVCWLVQGVGAFRGQVDPVAEMGRRMAEARR